MALVWFLLVLAAAGISLLTIRRFFGARRAMRRMSLSLAVCERALEDALGELATGSTGQRSTSQEEVTVSSFDPAAMRLLSIPESELYALGPRAVFARQRLARCIQSWNAVAGRTERRSALLPLALEAHHLARELLAEVEAGPLEDARARARDRVLFALVTPPEQRGPWVH
ncbi:MAG: hypothetical protein ACO3JL_04490 [Myxococcota bacterium]